MCNEKDGVEGRWGLLNIQSTVLTISIYFDSGDWVSRKIDGVVCFVDSQVKALRSHQSMLHRFKQVQDS